MKGFLSLLLIGLLPAASGLAQSPTPTPQEDTSKTFSLKLTDDLIEELKKNPEGLVAVIPVDQRGAIGRVKVYYEAPPVGADFPDAFDPMTFHGPLPNRNGFDGRTASNRPSLEDNSFSGMQPIDASRSSQSTLFNDRLPNNNSQPTLPPLNPSFGERNTTSGDSCIPNHNTGFPTNSSLPQQPTDSTFGQPSPGPATSQSGLERQYELLKQQADQLEARRLAQQRDRDQQALLDKIVDARLRLEQERRIQERMANTNSGSDNPSFLNSNIYDRSPYNSPPISTRRADYRTDPEQDSLTLTDEAYSGYGQRLVDDSLRTTTRVAMAPHPAEVGSGTPERTNPGFNEAVNNNTTTQNESADNTNSRQSERTIDGKTNAALLLFFLISVALNVYLGLLARGFYVKYNYLADELRETFNTAT